RVARPIVAAASRCRARSALCPLADGSEHLFRFRACRRGTPHNVSVPPLSPELAYLPPWAVIAVTMAIAILSVAWVLFKVCEKAAQADAAWTEADMKRLDYIERLEARSASREDRPATPILPPAPDPPSPAGRPLARA